MGVDKNSGKGSRLLKTKTDRPSIIKKEHVTTKLKGSFGSPLCFLLFVMTPLSLVRAGLLAKAVCLLDYLLDVLASSLASQLLQGILDQL